MNSPEVVDNLSQSVKKINVAIAALRSELLQGPSEEDQACILAKIEELNSIAISLDKIASYFVV
jgi:hypothetical protein